MVRSTWLCESRSRTRDAIRHSILADKLRLSVAAGRCRNGPGTGLCGNVMRTLYMRNVSLQGQIGEVLFVLSHAREANIAQRVSVASSKCHQNVLPSSLAVHSRIQAFRYASMATMAIIDWPTQAKVYT